MCSLLSPFVSVVMSVYDGEKYLREAVDSILAQTFSDFEFIIIDDGSTDDTYHILEGYKDERIKLIKNSQNYGLAWSLNRGISLASGEYIARMDCDDISYPERFMAQVEFMDRHGDIDVVGSWIEYIDTDGRLTGKIWKCMGSVMGLRWLTFFNTPMPHPAVMARRRFFDLAGQYNAAFKVGQDYELWVRSNTVFRFSNIQRVLLKYRVHGANYSKNRVASPELDPLWGISPKYVSIFLKKEITPEIIQLIITPQKTRSLTLYCQSIDTLHAMYIKFRKEYFLQPQEIVDINLDFANRISQITYKNPHIPFSWLLRPYAVVIVILTLIFSFLKNRPATD